MRRWEQVAQRFWRRSFAWAIACIVVFVVAGWLTEHPHAREVDATIVSALREAGTGRPLGPGWLPDAARDITALGSAAILAPLNALVIALLLLQTRRGAAAQVFVATVGSYALSAAFKHSYDRLRPDEMYRLIHIESASYPSGHATGSAATFLSIALVIAMVCPQPRVRWYIYIAAALVIVAVGASRVYLGVHYATDVLGGWALGAAWTLVCRAIGTAPRGELGRASVGRGPQSDDRPDGRMAR